MHPLKKQLMKRIIMVLLFTQVCVINAVAQQKYFDQSMQLKNCTIQVKANAFIAETRIEMEWYNPKEMEVEGLQRFSLNRGQVITAFQLELNGKFRDGSIEEKWKANRAYSQIVGKRIDPAILQMDYQDNYSLRIYPIPAKSSRKISFTVIQMITQNEDSLKYEFPLNFPDITDSLSIAIEATDYPNLPITGKGFLHQTPFKVQFGKAVLEDIKTHTTLNQPLAFSMIMNKSIVCTRQAADSTDFLIRVQPDCKRFYTYKPAHLTVYWEASKLTNERDLSKELDFLEAYLNINAIQQADIILFNHRIIDTFHFNTVKGNFGNIRTNLLHYQYRGAVNLQQLNFSTIITDAILLFSSGSISVGNDLPVSGTVPINCVVSSSRTNYANLQAIIGQTGGQIINCKFNTIQSSLKKIEQVENYLLGIKGGLGNIKQSFPITLDGNIFLSGRMPKGQNIQLLYGNNTGIHLQQEIVLSADDHCNSEAYHMIDVLKKYDQLLYSFFRFSNDWQSIFELGLKEKLVTAQTSFLVLERIEDYIKYQIAPPKELEAKCAELNYVYSSTRKIQQIKSLSKEDALRNTIGVYNRRIQIWNPLMPAINLSEPLTTLTKTEPAKAVPSKPAKTTTALDASVVVPVESLGGKANSLSEVVVTTAMGVRRTAKTTSTSAQYISANELNTIRGINLGDALAGKIAGIQIRSQSAVALGRTASIRIRGESDFGIGSKILYVVNGTIISDPNDINLDDIEDVTVLQGPSAAALFGADGANGAIVINTKRARANAGYYRWAEYKLNDQQEMDYISELRNDNQDDLWETYLSLEKDHENELGFYYDVADYFFDKGRKEQAMKILYNGIALCKSSLSGIKLAAYILEDKKEYDAAIKIYQELIRQYPLNQSLQRELALAYYQKGAYQEAVDTYYAILLQDDDEYDNGKIKQLAMVEWNAIIAAHQSVIDIKAFDARMIKAVPLDLRITVELSDGYTSNIQFVEPGGEIASYIHPLTKQGGRLEMGLNLPAYYYGTNEYAIQTAPPGKYRIKLDSYNSYDYPGKMPSWARVVTFKNLGRNNQSLQIENMILDNQYGHIEIGQVKW